MTAVRVVQDGEITLFAASLDRQEPLDHLLSPVELDRADRFKFAEHRRRYVAGRGLLRSLLGQGVEIPPKNSSSPSACTASPVLSTTPTSPST